MVTVVLSATHVPLSRHNFLNLLPEDSGEDEDNDDEEWFDYRVLQVWLSVAKCKLMQSLES